MYRNGFPGAASANWPAFLTGQSAATCASHARRTLSCGGPTRRPRTLSRPGYKQRRGELDAKKAAALDRAVPGWRIGRKRGRPARA